MIRDHVDRDAIQVSWKLVDPKRDGGIVFAREALSPRRGPAMSHVTRLLVLTVTTGVGVLLFASPAAANMQVKSVIHVDETDIESGICPFDLTVHLHGSFKNVDYFDNSGFLYKTIDTPGGGGPFTVSYSANGTTLTQRNEAFSVVITYNPDGSVNTYTQRGPFDKFTTRGGGIVLLDTGKVTFQEPEENVLFIAGPHQAVIGEFDAFCAAFA